MGAPAIISDSDWFYVLGADQMILECMEIPKMVSFIQCISVIGVVVNLV